MGRLSSTRRWGAAALTTAALSTGAVVLPTTAAHAAAPNDHVLYWNDVLVRTYRQLGGAPGPLARAGAMLHGAIYDAANSALCAAGDAQCIGQPYRVKVSPTPGIVPDLATAIDYAAYDTLRSVFPGVNFDADLSTAQEGTASSPARTDGQRIGSASAQAMISFRTNDGSPDNSTFPFSDTPGVWRPTGSGAAATPSWGLVKPFAMTSGAQFRPGLPAGYSDLAKLLASPEYATQVNEVKDLGRYNSTSRTADQTQAAWFWANDLDKLTYKPPGQLFAHTQIVAKSAKLTQAGNARLFALVAIALADAGIVAWDAKYQTPIALWRPESAIQLADTDGNPATKSDANWKPLSADDKGVNFSPPFPAYTSGHATFAGAWASAMTGFFNTDAFRFTATTQDPHAAGVTRTFATFSSAATENARSRVYLGVHYQWDADAGMSSGTAMANYVTANFLRPTTSYTFDGFYLNGSKIGDYIDAAPPRSFTFGFAIKDSAGTPVTDSGAVTGTSWNGHPGGAVNSAPIYNPTTGRIEVSTLANRNCSGPQLFSVLLRDGSTHSITVDCNVV
ncbi:vanadium-dependent haloperoxidase [Micromonospora sp. NPDC047738]|uniref:vanadium-dependent haloperoxidase n=1 Tax=unclassified Micromonospora TaxID=2617518 RepID=UPI003410968A